MLAPGDEQQQNGRVTFGDAPGNSFSLDVLREALCRWHSSNPAEMGDTLGRYIHEVVFGVPPGSRRRPRGG